MKFTLTIELGNDAVQDFEQIADALTQTAYRMYDEDAGTEMEPQKGFDIRDANGNIIGQWEITR